MVKVFAPVSIGNLSVGFDSLGLALAPVDGELLGDTVTIKPTGQHESRLSVGGDYAGKLPQKTAENIVWQCYLTFCEALKTWPLSPAFDANRVELKQPIEIHLAKNIPISSGLGSSASSIVAALAALNEYFSRPFEPQQLLRLMGEMEGRISGGVHYDNVAPSYFGGLKLMVPAREDAPSDQPPLAPLERPVCQSLPFFDDAYWVIAYPNIEVSTRLAREILPDAYVQKDVVTFGQRLACFVDACHRRDQDLALDLIEDVVAEPYRVKLLDNFASVKQFLLQHYCKAVGISGSGPTLFAACETLELAVQTQQYLSTHYLQNEGSFCHICQVDNQGSRVIE